MASNEDDSSGFEEVRKAMDNYRATVEALLAFVSVTTWKDGAFVAGTRHSLGRRLDTSPDNAIRPETEVTPDATIQQSDDLGYIVEAKKTLPSDRDYWNSDVRQLRQYDDDLRGWWTPNELIPERNVVALIGIPRAADFAEYVDYLAEKENWSFSGRVCFIEFGRLSEVEEFLYLRIHAGDMEGPELKDRLRKGIPVPLEPLLNTFRGRKFYDAEAPIEYVMEQLWLHIFHPLKSEAQFDEALRCWPLRVNVYDLTQEAQRLFGSVGGKPREVEFPKVDWVRSALDAFVAVKLAKPLGNGDYLVLFKYLVGDPIRRFAKHRRKRAIEEKPELVQKKLFDA